MLAELPPNLLQVRPGRGQSLSVIQPNSVLEQELGALRLKLQCQLTVRGSVWATEVG